MNTRVAQPREPPIFDAHGPKPGESGTAPIGSLRAAGPLRGGLAAGHAFLTSALPGRISLFCALNRVEEPEDTCIDRIRAQLLGGGWRKVVSSPTFEEVVMGARQLLAAVLIGAALPLGYLIRFASGTPEEVFFSCIPSKVLTVAGGTLLLRPVIERIAAKTGTGEPDPGPELRAKVELIRHAANGDPLAVAVPIVRAMHLGEEVALVRAGSVRELRRYRWLALAALFLSVGLMVPRVALQAEGPTPLGLVLAWDIGVGVMFPAFILTIVLVAMARESFSRAVVSHTTRLLDTRGESKR